MRRNISRIKRFERFRHTAPPNRFVAIMPNRLKPCWFGKTNSVWKRPRTRTPACCTLRNSGLRRMRSRRVRVLFTFSKLLISNWLRGGKPFPTFGSPTLEDETTVFCTHPFSESMRALAAAAIWLISPFHFVQSPQNAARNSEQIALKDELVMIVNYSRSCQRSPQAAGRPPYFLVTFPEKFRVGRHLLRAVHCRILRARSLSVWAYVTAA